MPLAQLFLSFTCFYALFVVLVFIDIETHSHLGIYTTLFTIKQVFYLLLRLRLSLN